MAALISPQPLAVGETIQSDINAEGDQIPQRQFQSFVSMFKGQKVSEIKLDLCPISIEQGIPTVEFSVDEVNSFTREEGLHQAVILKFSYGKPELQELRRIFSKIFDVKGKCNIGQLEFRHILVRFDLYEDFANVISRTSGFVKTKGEEFFFRTFPWTMGFNPREETSKAVIWMSLPDLPTNLFAKKSLLSIASMVGKPIAIDKATQDRTRPSTARVKILVNLLDNLPKKSKIKIIDTNSGKTIEYEQRFVFDNLPKYCTFCYHQGHDVKSCRRISNDLDAQDGVHSLINDDKLKGDARVLIDAKIASRRIEGGPVPAAVHDSNCPKLPIPNVEKIVTDQAQSSKFVPALPPLGAHLPPMTIDKAQHKEKQVWKEVSQHKDGIHEVIDNVAIHNMNKHSVEENVASDPTSDCLLKAPVPLEVEENVASDPTADCLMKESVPLEGNQDSGLLPRASSSIADPSSDNERPGHQLNQHIKSLVAADNSVLIANDIHVQKQSVAACDNNTISHATVQLSVSAADHTNLDNVLSSEVNVANPFTNVTVQPTVQVISSDKAIDLAPQEKNVDNTTSPGASRSEVNVVEDSSNVGPVQSSSPLISTAKSVDLLVIEPNSEKIVVPEQHSDPKDDITQSNAVAQSKPIEISTKLDEILSNPTDNDKALSNNNDNFTLDTTAERTTRKIDEVSGSDAETAIVQQSAFDQKFQQSNNHQLQHKEDTNREELKATFPLSSTSDKYANHERASVQATNTAAQANVFSPKTVRENSQPSHSHNNSQISIAKKATTVSKRTKVSKSKVWTDQRDYDDEETWGDGLASFSWEEEEQEGDQEDSDDSVDYKKQNHRAIVNQSASPKRSLNHKAPVFVPKNLKSAEASVGARILISQASSNNNKSLQTGQIVTTLETMDMPNQILPGRHFYEEGEEEDILNHCREVAFIKGDLSPMHSAKNKKSHQRESRQNGKEREDLNIRKLPMRIAKHKHLLGLGSNGV